MQKLLIKILIHLNMTRKKLFIKGIRCRDKHYIVRIEETAEVLKDEKAFRQILNDIRKV